MLRPGESAGNARPLRLYVNIDHVATLRQARRGTHPDPVAAALLCEAAGVEGITAHLREDRRHIQDADIEALATQVRTVLNLEMAVTSEMVEIARRIRPFQVTLVPERRAEITTEGGLSLSAVSRELPGVIQALRDVGSRVSLFIDPDPAIVAASAALGVDAIELHTGQYAHHPGDPAPLASLVTSAQAGAAAGMAVHAGHGLSVENVGPVAAIPEIEELNIGHAIVGRAIFVGLPAAIAEVRAAMHAARHGSPIALPPR
ncbi:MAG: pyridoxine 5'-phosphate synthase [Gemmatimonadaceae bacterium]|jgi:pyridoxine 5-phosphate synthase|nr:pyridoxine 5'-phosphate synthase [Gemmatimonadaceae bacterium]